MTPSSSEPDEPFAAVAERSGLLRLVRKSYDVFSDYALKLPMACCPCGDCLSPERQKALARYPTSRIPWELVNAWQHAAAPSEYSGAFDREVRYMTSRTFDLLAHGYDINDFGSEIELRRLRSARWKRWPDEERQNVQDFLDHYLLTAVSYADVEGEDWPMLAQTRTGSSVLAMVVHVDGDLDRAFKTWERASQESAALHMADMRSEMAQGGGDIMYNPFLDGREEQVGRVTEWATSEAWTRRIEEAFFAVADDHVQADVKRGLLSNGLQ